MTVLRLQSSQDVVAAVGSMHAAAHRTITPAQIASFTRAVTLVPGPAGDSPPTEGGPMPAIVPDFLLVSLAPGILREVFDLSAVAVGGNYGVNRVEILRPCPVGSRLACTVQVGDVLSVADGVRMEVSYSFRLDGCRDGTQDLCAVTMVHQLHFAASTRQEAGRDG